MVVAGLAVVGCATDADGPVTAELPAGDALVMGNPSCAKVGARLGRALGRYEARLAVDGDGAWSDTLDGLNRIEVTSEDGRTIDWRADVAMDAVLVVGRYGVQAYVYDPEAVEDAALTAPAFADGRLRPVTAVVFCYDHELRVTATARTSFVRTTTWGVEVAPEKVDVTVPAGHVKWVGFVASAFPTGTLDSNHVVRGTLAITNPIEAPVELLAVVEPMSKAPVRLTCGKARLPMTLRYGTTVCSYSLALPGGVPRTLVLQARTRGMVDSGSVEVPADFAAADVVVRDARAWLWDSHAGFLGIADAARTFAFELPIGPYAYCPAVGIYIDSVRLYPGDSAKPVEARTWLRVKVPCDR
jgi:hypothetical protein